MKIKRVAAAMGLLGAAGIGTHAYRLARADAAPIVQTGEISRGDIIDAVATTGTVQAVTTVQEGSQASGNISRLGADFNSIVHKGQMLATLDPSLFEAEVEQARANLNQMRANLTRAQSDLEQMNVQLVDAQQKYTRASELAVKRLIPQSDLDAAQIAVDAARAGVTAQQATVEQTQAAVRQSEASVDQTEVNVAHTIITAPIDGIVIQRSVDVGQTVAASLQSPTLFVIAADLTTLQVSADIDEADIASADSPDRLGASSGLHGPPARERGSGRCGFVAGSHRDVCRITCPINGPLSRTGVHAAGRVCRRPLVPPPQGESAGNHRRHARGHRDREVTHINFHTPSRGDAHGGAIVSDEWPDEADAVAVRVTDDEVAAPPRLLLELLVERRAGRHVFGVERFHVLDLDEGGDESIPVLRADGEHGLVHEFEMYTGTVARHGAVERRVTV